MDCRQPTHIFTPWHPTIHAFGVTVGVVTATCTGVTTIPQILLGNGCARNLMFDGGASFCENNPVTRLHLLIHTPRSALSAFLVMLMSIALCSEADPFSSVAP